MVNLCENCHKECKDYRSRWCKECVNKCKSNIWSKEDIEYLLKNYEHKDRKKMEKRLNRKFDAIRTKAKKYNLKRNVKFNIGKRNGLWKGTKLTENGYIKILKPNHPRARDKYIWEHILIVEKKIGRFLNKSEVVHHINGVRNDNRIENLMLFESNSKHLSFHHKIKQFGYTGPILKQINERWK